MEAEPQPVVVADRHLLPRPDDVPIDPGSVAGHPGQQPPAAVGVLQRRMIAADGLVIQDDIARRIPPNPYRTPGQEIFAGDPLLSPQPGAQRPGGWDGSDASRRFVQM